MTLRTVLLSLQALLAAAEPDDPQDAVVANQVGVCARLWFSIYYIYQTFLSVIQAACLHRNGMFLPSVVAKQCTHRTSIQLSARALAVAIKNYPNVKCVPLAVISEVCVCMTILLI